MIVETAMKTAVEVVKCDRFLYQSQIGEPLWKGKEYLQDFANTKRVPSTIYV